MAGLSDLFGGSPKQQGLMAAIAQIAQASGPQRTPQGLYSILGGGLMAGQQATQQAREHAQVNQLREFAIKDKRSDYEAQQKARAQAAKIAERVGSLLPTGSAASVTPQFMASAMPGGEGSPKTGGPAWLQAYQQQNGLSLPQVSIGAKPGNQTDAYVQRLLSMAQIYAEEGNIEGANKLYEQAAKLRPKVKEYQKVKHNGGVYNQAFYEDGTPGEIAGAELAQNLNWQDIGRETLGLDPTYGTVVARQNNSVSPNTEATVAASRENAAATRAVAGATRDAALIQRNQATELKLADDYRTQSKAFKETSDAYRQLTATLGQSTKSPAATLAAATKFMKLLDPGSVVRESELGMALAASGVIDRAFNYFNTLQSGRMLTPTQAADFQKVTEQIYGAAAQGQQAIDANYRQQAQTYGLRPEMIVQDLGQNKPISAGGSSRTFDKLPPAAQYDGRRIKGDNGWIFVSRGGKWVKE